jgi:hypothetical protein
MTNDNTCKYKRIKISEKAKGFLSDVQYSSKLKILEIKFGEKYGSKEIKSVFKVSNLQKSFENLRKTIEKDVPTITDEDFRLIEDTLLDNVSNLEIDENDEIESSTESKSKPEISFEEWEKTLQEKYQNIRLTCNWNFPGIWNSIEFELSVLRILNIKGCTLPFGGIILGPPSSSKTLGIELFRDHKNVYYTDSFSAKAFVTHNTSVKKEELNDIDLLPKIKNKCLLAPELSPLFSKKDDDLIEILGILTRILDGHGYQSDSGAHGRRGYSGEHMFTMIGAAVDIPYKVHKQLATLGPKLYFLRIPKKIKKDDDYIQMLQKNDFNSKKTELSKCIKEYLQWFNDYCPYTPDENHLVKIPFNDDNLDRKILAIIVNLGKLLAHLRGAVTTWNTEGTQGSNYGYSTPTIEDPDRAMTQLLNLAKGHALSQGRNFLTLEDIPILIKVVLSTASIERVVIFDLLLSSRGTLTTSQITTGLKISKNTALKTMAQLKVLGLVEGDMVDIEDEEFTEEIGESNYNAPKSITLAKDFEWFLSEEFQGLREGFVPDGKSKYDKNLEGVKKNTPQATIDKSIAIEQNGNLIRVPEESEGIRLESAVNKSVETTDNSSYNENREPNSLPQTLKKYDDIEDEFDFDSLENAFWEEFKEIERLEDREPFSHRVLIGHIKLRNAIKKSSPIITDEVAERLLNKLVKDGKLIELREGQYYRNDETNAAATAAA